VPFWGHPFFCPNAPHLGEEQGPTQLRNPKYDVEISAMRGGFSKHILKTFFKSLGIERPNESYWDLILGLFLILPN
jgi:hypothetical protein